MSLALRLNCLLLIVFCIACAPSGATGSNPIGQVVTVKIKLDERSMIIVPVRLNSDGPYDFVLDTGCSKTIVDRKLASALGLPQAGGTTIVGVLASVKMPVVRVNSLSVAGATVQGGEVFSADHAANVASRVRGVLCEDYLQNFDVLIDYRHMVMRLEPAPGRLAEAAVGEHLPLQLPASGPGGLIRRLVISGRAPELGDTPISLLLDSGTNQLTLFRENLGPGAFQAEPESTGSFSQWVTSTVIARRIRFLNLGHTAVSNLIVIAHPIQVDIDSDGLLPTSLFHSIFISHFGRFIILNPSFPSRGGDAEIVERIAGEGPPTRKLPFSY